MIRVNDLNIVVYPYFITGYEQCRTHRKKRINKKWAKIYGDKPIYDAEHIYVIEDTLFMSPVAYERLMEGWKDNLREHVREQKDASE